MRNSNETGQVPQSRASRRRSAGISLIEVVIAMSILAFGVLAGAAAQVSAIKLTSQSQLRTEAYYLAEQQLEAFRAMTGTSVAAVAAAASYPNDPANPIDPDPNDGLTRAFNRSWTIAADTPEAGLYTLTVRVIWLSALGLPQVVTLETIKVDT